MKWLQALKMAPQSAELFYCIALHSLFVKGDSKKAQACCEKALAYKPHFSEAAYLLCALVSQSSAHKAASVAESFEATDRTCAFTYLFKGVYDL